MMAESTPSLRISELERAEAQRALQHHLGTGRLQLAEFLERFAGAASAVTASEIAALFADLPPPHPTLPEPPRERTRWHLVMVGAVVVLALVGLGFVIGQGQTSPAASAGADAAPTRALPTGTTVRRTTGPGMLTLHPTDGVDLDDVTSPTWNIGAGCCGRDVGFDSDASQLSIDGGHAVVTGPPEFATCFHETAYTKSPIERGSLQPGATFCVRTNGHRLALVTIVDVTDRAIDFGTTVWDPPIP